MERSDYLKPDQQVEVTIWSPDEKCLYQASGNGYHNIASAIEAAIANASLQLNPEDCVFEVKNETTGVSHRYRINAHGNLKLIV